jgi:WhiB family transcriptional regulator, redox-sensing transcriptional regulator
LIKPHGWYNPGTEAPGSPLTTPRDGAGHRWADPSKWGPPLRARKRSIFPYHGWYASPMPYTFPGAVLRANEWRAFALCADVDPEIFFPAGDPGRYDPRSARALDICADCPVIDQCRTWALDSGLEHGIAGGMTAPERRYVLGRRADMRAALDVEEGAEPAPRADAPGPDQPLRPARGATVRARGIAMLIEGELISEIALELDVAPRTVERWAARPEVRARRVIRPQTLNVLSRREAARCGARRVS